MKDALLDIIKEAEAELGKKEFSSVVACLNDMAGKCLKEDEKGIVNNEAALNFVFSCAQSENPDVEQAAAFLLLCFHEMGEQEALKRHPFFRETIGKLTKSPYRVSRIAGNKMSAAADTKKQSKPKKYAAPGL